MSMKEKFIKIKKKTFLRRFFAMKKMLDSRARTWLEMCNKQFQEIGGNFGHTATKIDLNQNHRIRLHKSFSVEMFNANKW